MKKAMGILIVSMMLFGAFVIMLPETANAEPIQQEIFREIYSSRFTNGWSVVKSPYQDGSSDLPSSSFTPSNWLNRHSSYGGEIIATCEITDYTKMTDDFTIEIDYSQFRDDDNFNIDPAWTEAYVSFGYGDAGDNNQFWVSSIYDYANDDNTITLKIQCRIDGVLEPAIYVHDYLTMETTYEFFNFIIHYNSVDSELYVYEHENLVATISDYTFPNKIKSIGTFSISNDCNWNDIHIYNLVEPTITSIDASFVGDKTTYYCDETVRINLEMTYSHEAEPKEGYVINYAFDSVFDTEGTVVTSSSGTAYISAGTDYEGNVSDINVVIWYDEDENGMRDFDEPFTMLSFNIVTPPTSLPSVKPTKIAVEIDEEKYLVNSPIEARIYTSGWDSGDNKSSYKIKARLDGGYTSDYQTTYTDWEGKAVLVFSVPKEAQNIYIDIYGGDDGDLTIQSEKFSTAYNITTKDTTDTTKGGILDFIEPHEIDLMFFIFAIVLAFTFYLDNWYIGAIGGLLAGLITLIYVPAYFDTGSILILLIAGGIGYGVSYLRGRYGRQLKPRPDTQKLSSNAITLIAIGLLIAIYYFLVG